MTFFINVDHFCLHHRGFSRILFENPVLRLELQKTTELPNNNINQTLSFFYFSTRYRGFSRILFENPVLRLELQKTTELQNNNTNQTLLFYFYTRYIGGLYLNGFSRILFENPVFDTTSLFETVLRNQSDIFIFLLTQQWYGVVIKVFLQF